MFSSSKISLVGLCLAIAFNLIACGADPERKVEKSLNPGCTLDACTKPNENNSYINLVYVKATGQDDVLHIMYSSINSFTIMLFKTKPDTKLTIDWENLLSNNASLIYNSIKFSDTPLESAGYAIATIYEFKDKKGDADMTKIPNNSSYWVKHNTAELIWNKFNISVTNNIGTFEGSHNASNGTFKFVIKYPGKTQRDKDLPHMLLNDDSSSIDFVLDSVEPKFNDSKFGVELLFLTGYDTINMESKRTLDDEFTPGTFKIWNVEISDKASGKVHNFLQWKPIFYFYDPRTLENSTITKQYTTLDGLSVPLGLASAFYDEKKSVTGMNISFGLEGNAKDGYYYPQTNYSVWTFSIGAGAAPIEKMSSIVTLVIFIGFGVPALVIVVGLVVMIVKKLKNSRSSEFNRL